jgi:hypothetical protein
MYIQKKDGKFAGRLPMGTYKVKMYRVFESFEDFLRKVMKITNVSLAITLFALGLYVLGVASSAAQVIYARTEIQVPDKTIPPILVKIAHCESGNSQVDKNGQVLINATKDMGKYQINVPIWGKKASEMGLNLAVEQDNEKFAVWLFENYGSTPWDASRKVCWNR